MSSRPPSGGPPEMAVGPITVLLVLALHAACEMLAMELEALGISVAGSCTTAAEALELIPFPGIRVAVLDTALPDGTGYRLCRQARAMAPALRILLLSSYDDGTVGRARTTRALPRSPGTR